MDTNNNDNEGTDGLNEELTLEQLISVQDNPGMPIDLEDKSKDSSQDDDTSNNNDNGEGEDTTPYPNVTIEKDGKDGDSKNNEGDNSDEDEGDEGQSQGDAGEKVPPEGEDQGEEGDGQGLEDTPLTQNFQILKDTGYLAVDDDFEFDGTIESFEEAVKKSEEAKASNYVNAFKDQFLGAMPEKGKAIVRYLLEGGDKVDQFLETYRTATTIEDADITDPQTQKEILTRYYKETSKYDDNKIAKMVSRLEKLDALQEDAEDALEELKVIEKQKQEAFLVEKENEELRKQRQIEEQRKVLRESISNSEAIADGRKGKVQAFLFNQITDKEGNTSTDYARSLKNIFANPEHLAQLADLLLDYNPNKGFDTSRFEKRGKSKATSNFRKVLEKTVDPKSRTKGSNSSRKSDPVLDMEKILKQMG